MFERVSGRVREVLKRLRGHGVIRESNIQEALRDIKMALLEADVNYRVVKGFLESVKGRALGEEVLESLTPAQHFIKIVREELAKVMGERWEGIELKGPPPSIIMLVGLQGSGKTTTAAKLARYFKKKGKKPLLIPADPYRPAAALQLEKLGSTIGVEVFPQGGERSTLAVCRRGIEYARKGLKDVVILDTAGRLHIDEALMEELRELKREFSPDETILVADAMTGQDAVRIAQGFNEGIGIDGIILTKLDGDARGGAALSMRMVTGRPIKFVGLGEGMDDLEPFHPDRMAGRILGMGDVLSLIDRAVERVDKEKAEELARRLEKDLFTLEDFRAHIRQIRRMGSLEGLLSMLPGFDELRAKGFKVDERALIKIEAIINSMTKEERRNPSILNGSRRRRIARGSGTTVQDVNRLIKQYQQMRQIIKGLKRKGMKGLLSKGLAGLMGSRI